MPTYSCTVCGDVFSLPREVVDRYPGWTPRYCSEHRSRGSSRGSGSAQLRKSTTSSTSLLKPEEVLDRYSDGPFDGVFTDGGAVPNPGPGGWGAVYVIGNAVVTERSGHEPDTTNNRMELTALINGAELVPAGTETVVYTDSRLAVQTITLWAAGWEGRGWKRKSGPVENLDLVRAAYGIYRSRPELRLEWIRGHSGARWNEYADALANAWRT